MLKGKTGPYRAFFYLHIGILLCLSSLPLSLQAGDLKQARNDFLSAEKALRNNNLALFHSLKKSLQTYPLYPYLQYQLLISDIKNRDSSQVDAFLTTYTNSPLARKLRKRWLVELARRKAWWPYLVFYKPGLGKKLACLQLQAQLKSGHDEEAMQQVEALWLTGKSLPDECDNPINTWVVAGHLTNPLAWRRIELAITAKQMGLAKYLTRYLQSETDKHAANTWFKVLRKPELILSKSLFKKDVPGQRQRQIALSGFKRLLRRAPEKAFINWASIQKRYALSEKQKYQGTRAVLISQIRQNHSLANDDLGNFKPNSEDIYFQETRLRFAILQSQWPRILTWLNELPAEEQQQERWRYWRARAMAATGEIEAAHEVYSQPALERSYHGFLAADYLDTDYQLKDINLTIDSKQQQHIAQWPGVQRARELMHLKRFTTARREWRYVTKNRSKKQLVTLAKLAQGWGWHDRAIFTLARTGYWDDLQLRFPLNHQKQVFAKAKKHQLSEAWVFAVIRQESAFSTDAVSPAGARGLMQLMPKTAAFIAKKVNLKTPKRGELANPNLNITLGTAYLERVYSRLGQHQALATAAYNAGPHRVRKWLPDTSLPADIWIESIPFGETRRYTERILYYTTIYELRLGEQTTRLSSRIPDIQPESQLAQAKQINAGNAAL